MSKTTQKPVKEEKQHEEKKSQVQAPQTNTADNIAQPDPNDRQSQEYIRENARKGESVFVPNVIGPDAVTEEVTEK